MALYMVYLYVLDFGVTRACQGVQPLWIYDYWVLMLFNSPGLGPKTYQYRGQLWYPSYGRQVFTLELAPRCEPQQCKRCPFSLKDVLGYRGTGCRS